MAILLLLSLPLSALSFGPLRDESVDDRARWRFRLGDLAALIVLLQLAAGAALAWSTIGDPLSLLGLTSGRALRGGQRTAVILGLMSLVAVWWWRNTRMLAGAGLTSGLQRFLFLLIWTPVGSLGPVALLSGTCLLFTVLVNWSDMLREDVLRLYVTGSALAFAGLMMIAGTRAVSVRIANDAFRERLEGVREKTSRPPGADGGGISRDAVAAPASADTAPETPAAETPVTGSATIETEAEKQDGDSHQAAETS